MLEPTLKKNDRKARVLIGVCSFVIFAAVVIMGRVQLHADIGFNPHVFAAINAVINTLVSILLIWALLAVKKKNYLRHKKIMQGAMILSIVFLVFYIAHHLLTGDTLFGDSNHDKVLSEVEKTAVGGVRLVYLIILLTHIFLAAIILPFILFTAYRGMISEFDKHKKLARITWPIWLYVSITGPVIWLLISPYYE
jgi:putative membrane protein